MLDKKVKISSKITIGLPLSAKELTGLKSKGFQSVVNLCTPGEKGLPLKREVEAAKVEELGMEYMHFPVSLSRLTPDMAKDFLTQFQHLPGPVYMHCRIGQRSVPFGLLAWGKRNKLGADMVLKRGRELGIGITIPAVDAFLKRCLRTVVAES